MNPRIVGPGKTAPALYLDFLRFDPAHTSPANVLFDHPPPQGEGPQVLLPMISCDHQYTTKTEQSFIPPVDLQGADHPQYKLALVCKHCRIHAVIYVTSPAPSERCPSAHHPVHHLQPISLASDDSLPLRQRYGWRCSAVQCQTQIYIAFNAPRLSDRDMILLTDTDLLGQRHCDFTKVDPDRAGPRQATPSETLKRLRTYISDGLSPDHPPRKRRLAANQRVFQASFGMSGVDCQSLLESLGFKYANDFWHLPNPDPACPPLQGQGDTERELLQDVCMELSALLWNFAQTSADNKLEPWPSADAEIERTLGAQGWDKRHAVFRKAANGNLAFYKSLGALPEFSDMLIEYCFDTQTLCDPSNTAYYFECLQVIAAGRSSEYLQTKVAMLESQECISRRDIRAAYRFFGVSPAEQGRFSDEEVLNAFSARLPDLSPAVQIEARAHLYKLGVACSSQRLINASRQTVETYEDALTWLGNGVGEETNDEMILSVVAVKLAESKDNQEICNKAVSVIAQARRSNVLNNWVLTGRTDGWTMGVDEALRHLNVDSSLEALDTSILSALCEGARLDRPGETTEQAIATLIAAVASSSASGAIHSPRTWPVGLTSHGNTCYLNSLLQYYFSIKALRDIILQYERYQLDTAQHAEKVERVGQRKITKVEILGGQKFGQDLKHLFDRMIRDPGSAVRPEDDLVCRAFLEPKDYALLGQAPRVDVSPSNDKQGANIRMVNGTDEKTNAELGNDLDMSNTTATSAASSVTLGPSDAFAQDQHQPHTPPATPPTDDKDDSIQSRDAPPLPPRRFSTSKQEALEKAQQKAHEQQDVTEVHDGAMFRLRSGMMPQGQDASGEQKDSLRDLFCIGIAETSFSKGEAQKPKVLVDSSIQLNVPTEDTDIYSALDEFFDLQSYEGNDDLETYKSIRALPPLLQINIPRIGFDSEAGAYKSTKCLKLEEEITLDRYCDQAHPSIFTKRTECWRWRKRLRALREEQNRLAYTSVDMNGPTVIGETAEYLASLDEVNRELHTIDMPPIEGDGDITSTLISDAQIQADRLVALETEMEALQRQISRQFTGLDHIRYRLAAVFFHRGGHGHGHYWIYIHDFANNLWRSYNDERVEDFTKLEDIFEAKTWAQGTPTYAVYVAADKVDYIQPVCRDPEDPVATAAFHAVQNNPEDAEMLDMSAPDAQPRSQIQAVDWDSGRAMHNTTW